MSKIKVTQVKSKIGRLKSQKATLEALGLRKLNQTVEHNATAPILGMVKTVSHLVSVEEIK
ncbi:50S ribosomal protein L30 [Tenacibaculum piscium]|uniref:Large ribosomal subunit protein uL30 n=1 Tax=Tenacibaculum piscium TaxID=1458515 RepID=A0A2H1YF73_9FLAO|nr:50S ribosomal protein L30 [Tenacibaculum piscium]MBE7628978.1 50S ribosomal protein L30 [Tenacibaculum piscium]MBE7670422.1 50S ribosomal protein L30 [Tenacibaculum piscium]MBE7685001.1 50S ribosomal protein L30 [Tenacibaculum piscium]MBE7689704.1 50S ribosomal protein L30 [Tenacibaculum piscium]MCG8183569.1 50S ribosomal protein L30 [Tenacibaculum piscium]